jgi:putative pyruvate formate lyase activating enzyme
MEPSYLRLWETGVFSARVEMVGNLLAPCRLCPRECRVDRLAGQTGFCQQGGQARVAKALPHFGEEPPLTGERGAGTVFFTGCALRCRYCQNYQISQEGLGEETSTAALADIFLDLQQRGCHNLDLVSPTPHWPFILEALEIAIPRGLTLPIVYNTHGYLSHPLLKLLDGIVDIYLPDMKYGTDETAELLSQVPGYTSLNRKAVREMFAQTGPLKTDEEGLAFRGLLVRHLVLPEHLSDTSAVLQDLLEISPRIPLSLMAQYRPVHRAWDHPRLSRPLHKKEYQQALDLVEKFGFTEVFIQDLESSEVYFPDFGRDDPFQIQTAGRK